MNAKAKKLSAGTHKFETVKTVPAPVLSIVYADSPVGVQMLELTEKTCRWPIGDPKKAGFHFCGDCPAPGRPYCVKHADIAYSDA